jgi:hypothetical protein
MNIRHIVALGLVTSLAASPVFAEVRTVEMASQPTTEKSTVNRAVGGSVTASFTSTTMCPPGDTGERVQSFPIQFQTPFTNANYVATVGLAALQAPDLRLPRVTASIDGRTPNGMVIAVTSFCNSRIASVTFNYLVVGN